MNKQTLHIARTAVFVALLVVCQFATSALGNTMVTGSLVNLLLILAVMSCDTITGLAVAIISPIVAKFIGIGPFWSLIPFIILGNITLVLIWKILGDRFSNKILSNILALFVSAICKFLVLYVGISKIAIPFILNLPPQKADVISKMFSYPQLITAIVGGAFAIIVLPRTKNAFSK